MKLTGPRTVYATFAIAVDLVVTVNRGALGSVVVDPLGRTCANVCSFRVPRGTSVMLTAKPGPNGYVWGNACVRARGDVCNLTITTMTSVVISFYEPPD